MKVLIDIPKEYEDIISVDNIEDFISDMLFTSNFECKTLDRMTRTEVHKEIFGIEPPMLDSPYCKCKEHCDKCSHKDDLNCDVNWWNSHLTATTI